MGWFSFASLLLSAAALIIVLRERSRRPYAGDLAEFREETARLMAEFNRVAERNLGMLDDRIAALGREIRRAQNTEAALKALLDDTRLRALPEPKKSRSKKPGPAEAFAEAPNSLPNASSQKPHPPEAFAYAPSFQGRGSEASVTRDTKSHYQSLKNRTLAELAEEGLNPLSSEEILAPESRPFAEPAAASASFQKPEAPPAMEPESERGLFEGFPIAKIKAHTRRPKHEILLQHLREHKNREELLEMGFSPNEINLALLSLSSEEGS